MPHFYVNPKNIKKNTFTIEEEQFHYLANVRRFSSGDEIKIFDGLGNSFLARIDNVTKERITGTVISAKTFQNPRVKISLYTAIPKGDRFEWLIEKASEIGIYRLIPVIYSRSVVSEISKSKFERYQKISLSASSQCSRADIMPVEKIETFESILKFLNGNMPQNTLNIMPWECEDGRSISKILSGIDEKITYINIFIGPEGGFEQKEINAALKCDFKTVTLGKNILRVETAAIVASSLAVSYVEN